MGKTLSEMTLEELWELFPIILSEHHDCWDEWYAEEEDLISALQIPDIRISHIGSTAVQNIWAKPIIDILLEIPETVFMDTVSTFLAESGYICMANSADRMDFNKGYTDEGFADRVFHLHLRYRGDNDELYFRDYLNDNPDIAKNYERLKLSLWKKYEHNRDAYTDAKHEFVEEYTTKAKDEYNNCYA